jgi:diguanylate cyclase (GGDEF)-like protein
VHTDKLHRPKRSLRHHLAISVTRLVLIMMVTSLLAVFVTSQHTVSKQIDQQLDVGLRVLDKLLQVRESALLSSAEVLTADFGFRQAIATRDSATIGSALENHAARINADLMMIVSLDGDVLQSTTDALAAGNIDFNSPEQKQLLQQVLVEGGVAGFSVLNGKLYQLIGVTIKAPQPIAIAVIGFEMNQQLALELQSLTGLHLSFVVSSGNSAGNNKVGNNKVGDSNAINNNADMRVVATTLQIADKKSGDQELADQTTAIGMLQQKRDMFRLPFSSEDAYASRAKTLQQLAGNRVDVYLSTSLSEAHGEFDQLLAEITLITLVSVVLAIGASMLLSNRVAQPVKQLAQTAKKLALGKYQDSININADTQELNDLISAFTSMQEDIRTRELKILHQARHDMQTGLASPGYLFQYLHEQVTISDNHFCIALINISYFRAINDTFGRENGDSCLREVATRLRLFVSEVRQCARMSADFVLYIPGALDAQKNETLQRIHAVLSEPFNFGDVSKKLEFSIGVAEFPQHGGDVETLWRRLNLAQDAARTSKKPFSVYINGQDEQHLRRLRLLSDLRIALAEENGTQLKMFYQPKMNLANLGIEHAEALIRWHHPVEGFVRPDDFIPLAEQTGIISEVTHWVLETTARQASQWKACGLNVCIAINLCAQDLVSPGFRQFIDATLQKYAIGADSISFEITESAIINEPQEAIALLNDLRARGFSIAVDDFGTGYSSLAQLKNLPVNELKIDKSFVLKLDENKDDQVIVRTTIEMAHRLGLHVVAEGVENHAAQTLLQQYGCDYMQGFYLCKPIAADDFARWLTGRIASSLAS